MTTAPLNVFQRLTRQWDALHPYNAGQILHLRGRADPERLSACWNQTLRDLGLGRVRVNGRRYSVVELNGEATPDSVRVIDPDLTIDQVISRELNHGFPPHDEFPFRPFVLQHAPDSYYIGVIYHHWVADSTSIRAIVREWFARTFELPDLRRDPLPLPRGGYWSFFGPHRARWTLAGGLFTSANW